MQERWQWKSSPTFSTLQRDPRRHTRGHTSAQKPSVGALLTQDKSSSLSCDPESGCHCSFAAPLPFLLLIAVVFLGSPISLLSFGVPIQQVWGGGSSLTHLCLCSDVTSSVLSSLTPLHSTVAQILCSSYILILFSFLDLLYCRETPCLLISCVTHFYHVS